MRYAYEILAAAAGDVLGESPSSPACPRCRSPLAAALDPDLRVPRYRCGCGFLGDMVHVLAARREISREEAVRSLPGVRPSLVELVTARERDEAKLAEWVAAAVPPSEATGDDWAGGRSSFLAAVGLPVSPVYLELLIDRVRVGNPKDMPLFGFRPNAKVVFLPLETSPGRVAGIAILRRCRKTDQVVVSWRPLAWVNAHKTATGLIDRPVVFVNTLQEYLAACVADRSVGRPVPPVAFAVHPAIAAFLRPGSGLFMPVAPTMSELTRLAGIRLLVGDNPSAPGWYDRLRPWQANGPPGDTVYVVPGGYRMATDTAVYDAAGRVVLPARPVVHQVVSLPPAHRKQRRYRQLQVSWGNGPRVWVTEPDLLTWVKDTAPFPLPDDPNKRLRVMRELATSACVTGLPPVTVCRALFGWDSGCNGFGLSSGLVRDGVFHRQPWRGKLRRADVTPTDMPADETACIRIMCQAWHDSWARDRPVPGNLAAAVGRSCRYTALLKHYLMWATTIPTKRLTYTGIERWLTKIHDPKWRWKKSRRG